MRAGTSGLRFGAPLVSPESAAALDREASASWGLDPFALVEAAGRSCAAVLIRFLSGEGGGMPRGRILVCAGPGNNGADALVMLRALLGECPRADAAVLVSRYPPEGERSPRSEALRALEALGVPLTLWNGEQSAGLMEEADLVIDGIAGTGLRGALEGIPRDMVLALNRMRGSAGTGGRGRRVVSVDVPSGAGSGWEPEFPLVSAGITLAVEPLKTVLYTPALRLHCGRILPVRGLFPPPLLERYRDADLLRWEDLAGAVPPVGAGAYKYSRGVAEIHAGSPGSAGAARIAAAGASAAGAGLIRLMVDEGIYPLLASSAGGAMVVPGGTGGDSAPFLREGTPGGGSGSSGLRQGRFSPDSLLLGPGWGRGDDRKPFLRRALAAEGEGLPLILDADAIALLDPGTVFHGGAILTPHGGELEALSGIPRERLLSNPPVVADLARRFNGTILFKSHVMIPAAPDGRIGFIDGMDPALAAGGSGDLLAGLCAAIAARMKAGERQSLPAWDPYAAAAASGALLTAASRRAGRVFYDPLKLAETAALVAGEAWLPLEAGFPTEAGFPMEETWGPDG